MFILKRKRKAPMIGCQPRDMLPLEQVACMIWLAESYSLKHLRNRQHIANQQMAKAIQRRLSEETLENLEMTWHNLSAAIAYQTFTHTNFWLCFIVSKDN